jgi:hypothetical protein
MPRIESSTTPLCVQLIWSMRFSWWDAQVHRRRPYQPPVALAVPRLCRFAARASFVTSGQIFVLGCHGALPSRAAQRLVLASAGAGPSKTCNTSSRTATRDKQMPREILYCHATRQTRTVGAGTGFSTLDNGPYAPKRGKPKMAAGTFGCILHRSARHFLRMSHSARSERSSVSWETISGRRSSRSTRTNSLTPRIFSSSSIGRKLKLPD